AEKYVNRIPVKKHDHVLIPAGTVHCSGADTMVLEISATPYIFTFKMWDWGRVGLDGIPRPIHVEHGVKNIQWDRTRPWLEENLLHQEEICRDEDGILVERTGLHQREFIDTHRYMLQKPVKCRLNDSVHVLNLVEGEKALIESPTGAFEPFEVHYAETFIIPASVGEYVINPTGAAGGNVVGVIAASVR
ncbi:MAG: mannose-6-phosphate isomerase, partial [Lachnospiraceae bacterium]|nr:mannose-6-phosphate isomerase [Lachnospiraceae bacterium]